MEKRKFIVALNLLRKPLLESLVFLSWMLGDEDGFYEAFTKASPKELETSVVGQHRKKRMAQALAQTELAGVIDSGDVWATLFDHRDLGGLHWVLQRAVHLVTTFKPEFATEPENFNFIFKKHTDDDVYTGLYKHLPTVLLYLSHVIAGLFDRMQPMDPGAKKAFAVRTTYGYHLIENDQVPEIRRRLSTLSEHFSCSTCGELPKMTRLNAVRVTLTESFRCTKCRRVNPLPFVWLF